MQTAVAAARPLWDSEDQLNLDSFIESLMSEPVSLNTCLVPGPLAAGFGLSTDSTSTSFGRELAAAFPSPSPATHLVGAEALQDALAATASGLRRPTQ